MDIRLFAFDKNIKEAEDAASTGDEAAKNRAEALHKEKNEFWLAELERRVAERPTDTALRHELGMIYFELERLTDATAQFQRAVRDPKLRVSGTTMIGKCFAAKGLYELAIDQLQRALVGSSLHEAIGKDIAYHLGELYEKTEDFEAAEETYQKVFEIDIGFRDIAEKMERVYKLRRAKKSPSNSDED